MWITINKQPSTEIDNKVVKEVLNLYPEEELINRPVFSNALQSDQIKFEVLKSESDKILIPWQMFFLNQKNLKKQLHHIQMQRNYKISPKLVTKRPGIGKVTSKRIVDRLIRQQNFLTSNRSWPRNPFCCSLKGLNIDQAAMHIIEYFEIERNSYWKYSGKGKSLNYIIRKIENKNINISRGVLANKLLPNWKVVSADLYRNTSGFAIKDDFVPFIFLPGEINPDEAEGRQIYTLVYLLVAIGLNRYDYFLDEELKAKQMIKAQGVQATAHKITSEVLMPNSETEILRNVKVTEEESQAWSKRLKVSPLAFLTTLFLRGVISKSDYDHLKPEPYSVSKALASKSKSNIRGPRVSTSIKKFCGDLTYRAIHTSIQNGTLKSVQAQHLIFGSANKKTYQRYLKEMGL